MAKSCNVIVFAFLIFNLNCASSLGCLNENPCLCEIDETHKIDLSPLTENRPSTDFLEDEDAHGNNFYFHGCKDGEFNATGHGLKSNFTSKGSFIYANITNAGNVTTYNFTVGAGSEIKFAPVSNEKNSYQLVYSKGGNVTVSVRLLCTQFETSFIKILSVEGTPSLALSSPHACIISHSSGLSTGSVLLILFFISLGVYFVGGCAVMYVMRGARGLEMIPNIDFWRSLPGLVKDGIIFLFSGCNAASITTSAETYDRI